jgi:dephospho-CoA kinase
MLGVCRLGLTGGIGSGKSTVAQMLAQCGAVVIDADALARNVTLSGGAAIAPIALQFGSQMITADGAMDREAMRELVYADADAKSRLEAIIHPLVQLQMDQKVQKAVHAGSRCIVFDVPLLVESGRWRSQVNQVLVVDCLPATQIDRVVVRSALSRDAVEKIMATQASRSRRLQAADIVLFNQGLSLEQLRSEVFQIAGHFGL